MSAPPYCAVAKAVSYPFKLKREEVMTKWIVAIVGVVVCCGGVARAEVKPAALVRRSHGVAKGEGDSGLGDRRYG